MKDNKYFILIKNTLILGFGLIGSKLVQFLLVPFFTNMLSPTEYGVIDLGVTFSNLMVPVVTANLADAVLRFGLSSQIKKEELLTNSLFILGTGTLISLAIWPFLNLYNSIGRWRSYIIIIIILQSFKINFSLYLKANDRIGIYASDSILTALLMAASNIVLIAFFRMGIKGYFLSEIIGNSFSILFLLLGGEIWKDIHLDVKLNRSLMWDMLRYSIPLMFNAVSWWITNFSDRILLNQYFTEKEVGLYSVAAKMPSIVTTIISVFTQAWMMSAIREYETSREEGFFNKVYAYYCAALFSVVSAAILLVKPFMSIYVGKEFIDTWRYIPFLLIGVVFWGIANFYGAFYAAAKRNLKEVKSTMLCAGSNIILNLILIPCFNIMGAVIATMLSYVILVIIRIVDTKNIVKCEARMVFILINLLFLLIEVFSILKDKIILASVITVAIILTNLFQIVRKMNMR